MSVADGRRNTVALLADPDVSRCATCDMPITSQPEWEDGQAFCCAGCVAGGPCICPRDPDVAAVGRRVTIQDQDRRTESFWLALPGQEHATADTVSIAGKTGGALAGARVGDVVYVDDGRRRWAVVMHVA